MGVGNKSEKVLMIERIMSMATVTECVVGVLSIFLVNDFIMTEFRIAGIVIGIVAVIFFASATITMKTSWRVGIPEEKTSLITNGIYSWSRNPAFVGFDLLYTSNSDKLFEFTKNNSEKLVFLDQDVINIVMQEGIKLLPTEWNTQVYNGTSSNVNDFKFIERSAIIHYIGNIKPWSLYYKFAIKKFYFLYLRKLSLKYNVVFLFLQIREYLYNFYSKTKYYRKKIVWYDKTNKKLILFTKIKIG